MASKSSSPKKWNGYSDAQWAEIDAAVVAEKLTPLTSADRKALTWMARAYRELAGSPSRSGPAVVKRWKAVAKAASTLGKAISEAKKQQFVSDPMFWATWRGYVDRTAKGPPDHEYSSFEEIVAEYGTSAKLIAEQAQEAIKPEAKKGLLRQFYTEALRVWFEHGGEISHDVEDPIFDYFRAVTGPVTGGEPVPDDTIKSFIGDMNRAGRTTAGTVGSTYLRELFEAAPHWGELNSQP